MGSERQGRQGARALAVWSRITVTCLWLVVCGCWLPSPAAHAATGQGEAPPVPTAGTATFADLGGGDTVVTPSGIPTPNPRASRTEVVNVSLPASGMNGEDGRWLRIDTTLDIRLPDTITGAGVVTIYLHDLAFLKLTVRRTDDNRFIRIGGNSVLGKSETLIPIESSKRQVRVSVPNYPNIASLRPGPARVSADLMNYDGLAVRTVTIRSETSRFVMTSDSPVLPRAKVDLESVSGDTAHIRVELSSPPSEQAWKDAHLQVVLRENDRVIRSNLRALGTINLQPSPKSFKFEVASISAGVYSLTIELSSSGRAKRTLSLGKVTVAATDSGQSSNKSNQMPIVGAVGLLLLIGGLFSLTAHRRQGR